MFNNETYMLLVVALAMYITQTSLLIVGALIFSKLSLKFQTNLPIYWRNLNFNYVSLWILLSFAGIPPLFFFFFKILIFLELEANTLILWVYMCVNTALLFYYVNFFYTINNYLEQLIINFSESTFEFFANLSTIILFLNTFAFLYFDYLSFWCLCLIGLRKTL